MVRIENEFASVEVTEKASEITSFKDKNSGVEYMYDGDPKYWSGRNPTLFPMVSNTYNKVQNINGKEYHMKNHGLVRYVDFECTKHTDNCIVMTYKSDDEAKTLYPFDFTMDIAYTLNGKKLDIVYTITNNDKMDMPFGFGLHPAFRCPLVEGEKFEDYHLEFSNTETLKGMLGPFGLNDEKVIPCDYHIWDNNPTIVFDGARSSFVELTNGKHGVRVTIDGYRYIAFWTKPDFPFVCIEPWHSHGDFEEVNLPFEKREDTMMLEPGKSYTTSYSVEIF